MKVWVGVTDDGWFNYLRTRNPDEVNFWQSSGGREFRVLQPGEPFLFKLHSPKNYIVGGGFFVRYSPLPCSLAWEAFGEKNGVGAYAEFLARIRKYRVRSGYAEKIESDPVVGCNVLAQPFFLAVISGRCGETSGSDHSSRDCSAPLQSQPGST